MTFSDFTSERELADGLWSEATTIFPLEMECS